MSAAAIIVLDCSKRPSAVRMTKAGGLANLSRGKGGIWGLPNIQTVTASRLPNS